MGREREIGWVVVRGRGDDGLGGCLGGGLEYCCREGGECEEGWMDGEKSE